MKIIKILAISLLCAFSISSCTSEQGPSPEEREYIKSQRKEITLDTRASETRRELKNFNETFTMDIVKYVNTHNNIASKNVVVSPLSAAIVFGMVANGVDDASRQKIMAYLGVSDIESLNAYCQQMIEQLPDCDDLADMRLANSFWVSRQPDAGFASILRNSFKAETFNVDFSKGKEVTKSINRWCEENTENLIKDFINEVSPDTYAMVLNALYFHAPWANEYFISKENTRKGIFHGMSADSEVEMMKGSELRAACIVDDNFEGCSLPFGNSAFTLTIIMPKDGLSITEASERLTPQEIDRLYHDRQDARLTIYIPKFKVEAKYDISEILNATGMFDNIRLSMFEKSGNSSTNSKLKMQQGSSFGIEETGAKAAAVTSGELTTTSVFIKDHYEVTIDRPFFFFIKEYSTGACILSGLIADI